MHFRCYSIHIFEWHTTKIRFREGLSLEACVLEETDVVERPPSPLSHLPL